MLQEKLDSNISVSYVDDYLYLAISMDKDYFAPDVSQNFDNYQKLEEHLEQVDLLIGIVDDLRLNDLQERVKKEK